MREYELTYLVSDDVLEADLKKITDHVAGKIADGEGPKGAPLGGKVTKEESWGRRKLAYPIAKQTFATYVTVWFESEAEKITQLEHELRVSPQIIRHLITLKVEKSEVLKVTREDIVGAEEVEKVIGEKSFEVIEGETEESRDLMSVREKDSTTQMETQIDADKEPREIEAEKPVEEKKVRKTKADKEVEKTPEDEPVAEEKVEIIEKPKKVAKPKKVEKPAEEKSELTAAEAKVNKEDEADRIKKLDEKLDELLKDDL